MNYIQKYWMVHNIDRGFPDAPRDLVPGPRVKHSSKHSAVAEASRLARLHSGQTFVVLESAEAYRHETPSAFNLPITVLK